MGKADAVFGLEKLDWFNSQYLRSAPRESLREMVRGELQSQNIWDANAPLSPAMMDSAIELLKPRAKKLGDFSRTFKAYFSDDFDYEEGAAGKFLADPKLREFIPELLERYAADDSFTLQSTEDTLREFAEKQGVKAGVLINALRVGLTGQGVAPGLFEVMQVLGRRRTIDRMQRLSTYLRITNDE